MALGLGCLTHPSTYAGADDVELLADEEADDQYADGDLGPETQIITTGCWLTMKEATLVIGKVADHAPDHGDTLPLSMIKILLDTP